MRTGRTQAGATLLVTLVMLIMLTLFALSAMNTSTTNLRMAGNVQMRTEALEATIQAQEKTVSLTRFIDSPTNALPLPCGTQNTLCPDLNGDAKPDYTVVLNPAPTCVQARKIKLLELKPDLPTSDDLACTRSVQQGQFAIQGLKSADDSICGTTVWDITAQALNYGATALNADVNVTSVLGVGVRIPATAVDNACP